MIQPGQEAPDFELPDNNGDLVKLSDFRGKKNVVVYFYPKDFSLGCTAEACAFRDSYEDFTQAGAEVIGISDDDVISHRHFASRYKLPFILLSDKGGKVRNLYGVENGFMGLIKGRVTFVVNKNGIIAKSFESNVNMSAHVEEALKVLK